MLEQRLDTAPGWKSKLEMTVKDYAIDTSAKILFYAPVMAVMEAYNGLNSDQIIQSRISAAVVDVGVARIYGKTLDSVRSKFHIKSDSTGSKAYAVDTITMIGIYTPVYAGILAAAGADEKQIGYSLSMGAIIAAITARPFGKYVLNKWRNLLGYAR